MEMVGPPLVEEEELERGLHPLAIAEACKLLRCWVLWLGKAKTLAVLRPAIKLHIESHVQSSPSPKRCPL